MKPKEAIAEFRKHLRLADRKDEDVARAIACAYLSNPTIAWIKIGIPHYLAFKCEIWVFEVFAKLPPSDLWDIFVEINKMCPIKVIGRFCPRLLLAMHENANIAVACFLCAVDRRSMTLEVMRRSGRRCPYAARQFELFCENLEKNM